MTLTGPRQSGKSTLCRHVFGDRAYVNLEAPDVRAFARLGAHLERIVIAQSVSPPPAPDEPAA